MRRTEALQGVRMIKFFDVLGRYEAAEFNQLEAAELLGGYLARTGDAPAGSMVVWRGLSRLIDIEIGAKLGSAALVGN